MQERTTTTLVVLLALLLAVITVGPEPEEPAAAAAAPPNVLIVLTDDQRSAGTMKVMPVTRRLFKRNGARYPQAYATTPLCCPSRATIMTGRYAHNHRVRNNSEAENLEQASTVQRYLHDAGYFTAISGKYLNQWDLSTPPPHFDRWAITPGPYFDTVWNDNGALVTVPGYSTDHVAERAVDFLRRFERLDDSRPWFLWVAPVAPHRPMRPARRHRDVPVPRWRPGPATLERNRRDKPPYVRAQQVTMRRVRKARRGQLRTLMAVDELVERTYDALFRLGENRRTLAFFLSDNGFMWGEHGLGPQSTAKRPPYTASVKIPMFVRWPGRVGHGIVDRRLTGNVDIAPTILHAAGVAPAPTYPLDGRSVLRDDTRSELFLEYFVDVGATPEWAAIRTATFHYIEHYGTDRLTPTFREYYNLERDPSQLRNLFRDGDPRNNPDGAALSARLDPYRRCAGSNCP